MLHLQTKDGLRHIRLYSHIRRRPQLRRQVNRLGRVEKMPRRGPAAAAAAKIDRRVLRLHLLQADVAM